MHFLYFIRGIYLKTYKIIGGHVITSGGYIDNTITLFDIIKANPEKQLNITAYAFHNADLSNVQLLDIHGYMIIVRITLDAVNHMYMKFHVSDAYISHTSIYVGGYIQAQYFIIREHLYGDSII